MRAMSRHPSSNGDQDIDRSEPSNLRRQIHRNRPFDSLEEETYLNLQRTANLLFQSFAQVIKAAAPGRRGLTPSQYNVMRILRGAAPRALTCGEISDRLVTPGPDVTRLLDRLEDKGWVARVRDSDDRRVVRTCITAAGLDMVNALDGPVRDWLSRSLGHLSETRQSALVEGLEEARATLEDAR